MKRLKMIAGMMALLFLGSSVYFCLTWSMHPEVIFWVFCLWGYGVLTGVFALLALFWTRLLPVPESSDSDGVNG